MLWGHKGNGGPPRLQTHAVAQCAGITRGKNTNFEMPAKPDGKISHEPRFGIAVIVGQRGCRN